MKNSFMIVITVTELSAITKKLVTYDKANLVVPSLDPHTLTCKPTSLNKIKTITRSMLDAFHYAIIGQYLEESDDGEKLSNICHMVIFQTMKKSMNLLRNAVKMY